MGHPPHFETTRHHKQSEAKRHNILRFAIFNHSLRWHIICGCLISCSKKKTLGGATGATIKKQQTKAHSWLICNHLDLPNLQLWRNGYTVRWRPPRHTEKLGSHWCPPNLAWWKLAGLLEKTWSKMVKNPCSIHWHLWIFRKLQIWFWQECIMYWLYDNRFLLSILEKSFQVATPEMQHNRHKARTPIVHSLI